MIADDRYVGRADDLDHFEGLAMAVGLTAGLAEPLAFIAALRLSSELSKSSHEYRVWYDANGKCVTFQESYHFGDGEENEPYIRISAGAEEHS